MFNKEGTVHVQSEEIRCPFNEQLLCFSELGKPNRMKSTETKTVAPACLGRGSGVAANICLKADKATTTAMTTRTSLK